MKKKREKFSSDNAKGSLFAKKEKQLNYLMDD
jgi:hypothetical protein